MPIYDVTVPLHNALATWPGDPGVEITDWRSLANGDGASVSLLHFGAHSATHVDAPAHFIEGAARIDSLSLESLIGPARVVRVPDSLTEITSDFLSTCDLTGVQRIIFHTRNSAFWNEGFRKDFTALTPEGAEMLVNLGVKLVGNDYLSIEKFRSGHHLTHLTLLRKGVVIVEGLNLSGVPDGDYEVMCLPLKIADGAGDGEPARVVLRTFES